MSQADRYAQALGVVRETGRVSTTLVQRSLGIGYNAAAELIERMEREGIASAPNGAGARELLKP